MINNFQLLRALAAIAVVFYHTGYLLFGKVHTEFHGVAIFFVLSGFLMTYTSAKSTKFFLRKRIIRIVPLYWLITLTFVVASRTGLLNPIQSIPLIFSNIIGFLNIVKIGLSTLLNPYDFQHLLTSLFFIPFGKEHSIVYPMLSLGWTLNLEMYFYFIFAFALLWSQKFAPLIAISILSLVIITINLTGCHSPVCLMYSHGYIHFFILGVIVFYLTKVIPQSFINQHRKFLLFLTVIMTLIYNLSPTKPIGLINFILHYGLPCSAVFLGFYFEKVNFKFSWQPIIFLGNASYAIFLVHLITVAIFQSFGAHYTWFNPSQNLLAALLAVLVSVLLSVCVYQYIELPMIKWLRLKYIGKT